MTTPESKNETKQNKTITTQSKNNFKQDRK